MSEVYHKINAPFMRDDKGTMIHGKWCMQELEYLANNMWEFTEKVDGTNIRLVATLHNDDLIIVVAGKTNNAQIPKPLLASIQLLVEDEDFQWNLSDIMRVRDIDTLTIYGEGYGPKINGGGKYGALPNFVAFDVKVGDFWLTRASVDELCDLIGIDTVPVIGHGSLYTGFRMVENYLQSTWGDFEAEGIIAVPKVPLQTRAGKRIITKIKHRDFRGE